MRVRYSLIVMMGRPSSRLCFATAVLGCFLVLDGFVGLAPCVLAADLVEPPDPGFSEVDLFAFGGDGRFDSGAQLYAGFGLSGGVSIWAGVDMLNGGPARGGVNVMVTRTLGEGMDLDLWIDLGVHSATHEAEIGRADWTVGSEWSLVAGRLTPYLRIDWYDDGASHIVHLLSGLVVPVDPVELHIELSSERPKEGAWPIHLAIGPNVPIGRRAELQPELSLLGIAGSGRMHWAVSLGVILDPRREGRQAGR